MKIQNAEISVEINTPIWKVFAYMKCASWVWKNGQKHSVEIEGDSFKVVWPDKPPPGLLIKLRYEYETGAGDE